MAEPVRARRLTDEEGRRLLQIVRRGSTGRSGSPISLLARPLHRRWSPPMTVRDVIHLFNAKGLAALDPRWAGGRPRLIGDDDVAVIVAAARSRPEKLGLPFTHWSLRKLAAI